MSEHQKALDLFGDKPLPSFLRPEEPRKGPPPRPRKGPPPRKAYKLDEDPAKSPGPSYVWVPERKKWVHFVFANSHRYPPPRPRKRPEFRPDLIDAERFLVCVGRPYPEWPLICKETGRGAFESQKAAEAWLKKVSPGASVFEWTERCEFCGMCHYETYPHEVTGNTSGKAVRKWTFLKSKGIDPHADAE